MGYWQEKPDIIQMSSKSVLGGTIQKHPIDPESYDAQLLKEFFKDNDLIEITIVSPCIGFTYTFTKHPNKE